MKNSEKRLALALGGLVVVFLIVLSINFYRKEHSQLLQERKLLESSAQEQNIWLRQSDLWLERIRWVRANQPVINSPRSSTADLFSQLEKMAGEAGVKIVKSRLYDPVEIEGLGFVEIGVQLTLDASLENLITWSAKVQNPPEFRLFKRFALNSQDDVPTMRLECTIVQWCVTSDQAGAAQEIEETVAEVDESENEEESQSEESSPEPVAGENNENEINNEATETTSE